MGEVDTTHMASAQMMCSALAGFLANYIENPEHQEKYSESYSGHIVKIQFNATVTEAIMIIARIWDKRYDGATINALYEFSRMTNEEGLDDGLRNSKRGVLSSSKKKIEEIFESEQLKSVRVYRTDWIAHMLPEGGRDRKNYIESFGPYMRPSYNSLIELLDHTAEVISELIYVASRVHHDPSGTRKLYYDYATAYWRAMPIFREVEQLP